MTIRDTLIAGARAIGADEVETRSSKYRVFRVKAGTPLMAPSGKISVLKQDVYLFFGKAGACRAARKPAATASHDSEAWRTVLTREARIAKD